MTAMKTKLKTLIKTGENLTTEFKVSKTETRVKTRVKIIKKIKLNPNITNQKLSEELDLTLKAIEWQMKKFKENKVIERIESARGGYWNVIDDVNEGILK